jgi:UDP-glucose 4-epimerase
MVASPERILITGAAGFLGTALSRHCARQGLEVFGLDIAPPGDSAPYASFHQTMQLEDDLGPILAEFSPVYLVNLAGSADVRRSLLDPREDFQRSAQLFFGILELVRRYSGNTKVLLASSAAVYGQPRSLPISESETPQPISPYGYHKWLCELMAKEYADIYGLKTASMRIFSAYGAGLRKQILWDLCRKCREGGTIELGGDGSESRDFIHADDVASAALDILRSGSSAGESYNVATGEEITISTVAQRVLEEFGVPTDRLRFSGSSRAGDPKNWRADTRQLASLGFKPAVDFSRGISEYIEWFKKLD